MEQFMKNQIMILAVVATSTLCLSGCSARAIGSATAAAHITGTKVLISQQDPTSRVYVPELAAVLAKHGFAVVGSGKAEYSATIEVNPGAWNINCNITLSKNGVPVISANGINPGFGNWITRGQNIDSVVHWALNAFDKKLSGQ